MGVDWPESCMDSSGWSSPQPPTPWGSAALAFLAPEDASVPWLLAPPSSTTAHLIHPGPHFNPQSSGPLFLHGDLCDGVEPPWMIQDDHSTWATAPGPKVYNRASLECGEGPYSATITPGCAHRLQSLETGRTMPTATARFIYIYFKIYLFLSLSQINREER